MEKYNAAVERNRALILAAQDYIWAHPETGFKEIMTSKYLETAFKRLGYNIVNNEDIPGFYTVVDTGRPGPEVLVLGELDALICADHPDANPQTGAVHCCGHSAQCAALLGIAAALKEQGILDELSGKIRLCAVPAEELIEIEYRTSLKNKGKIHYLGGKSEFLYRGCFDGVDLALMVHTIGGDEFVICKDGVGSIVKHVLYKGVSAHAGASPWEGCNALYAATTGIVAINSIRETFKEPDMIRVHPIITQGGDAVNAIPDIVMLESYVRGSSFDAMKTANSKALCGAALSLGANVEIRDIPGYAPLCSSEAMLDLAEEATAAVPELGVSRIDEISSGSTDMGELSCLMPVVHPYVPGAEGTIHGADYRIANPELACVDSAKWQLEMLRLLLKDGAARAKRVKDEFKPMFDSKDEYFEYIEEIMSNGSRITYNQDKTATVKL